MALLAAASRGAPVTLDQARALQEKGAVREAQKAYEALLPQLRASDPAALATALKALSKIATSQGRYGEAAAMAREAATVERDLGDKRGEAHAIHLLGVAELYQAHYASALEQMTAALAIARTIAEHEREVEELK